MLYTLVVSSVICEANCCGSYEYFKTLTFMPAILAPFTEHCFTTTLVHKIVQCCADSRLY